MRLEDVMRAGNRLEILVKVTEGVLSMEEASSLLGISKRHCRRITRKSETLGLQGLLNQRSHKAWNKVSQEEEREILELRRTFYRSYNLQHFRDTLFLKHGIKRSREYYRKLFLLEGLYTKTLKRRIKQGHRKRFEAPSSGLLIQRDTSIHLWVLGAPKPWKLIVNLDDHSRKITGALFSEHDDVLSNMMVTLETLETHGVPRAYYTDNNPIFNPLNKKPLGMYGFYRMREKVKEAKLSKREGVSLSGLWGSLGLR